MKQTLLELDGLSKSFGRLKAVDQLTFTLKKGNSYGLLGPNGVDNIKNHPQCGRFSTPIEIGRAHV